MAQPARVVATVMSRSNSEASIEAMIQTTVEPTVEPITVTVAKANTSTERDAKAVASELCFGRVSNSKSCGNGQCSQHHQTFHDVFLCVRFVEGKRGEHGPVKNTYPPRRMSDGVTGST